jgi:hypothetical protein
MADMVDRRLCFSHCTTGPRLDIGPLPFFYLSISVSNGCNLHKRLSSYNALELVLSEDHVAITVYLSIFSL